MVLGERPGLYSLENTPRQTPTDGTSNECVGNISDSHRCCQGAYKRLKIDNITF